MFCCAFECVSGVIAPHQCRLCRRSPASPLRTAVLEASRSRRFSVFFCICDLNLKRPLHLVSVFGVFPIWHWDCHYAIMPVMQASSLSLTFTFSLWIGSSRGTPWLAISCAFGCLEFGIWTHPILDFTVLSALFWHCRTVPIPIIGMVSHIFAVDGRSQL